MKEFKSVKEVNEAYLNGEINKHKRDMELLRLSKVSINDERRLSGLFDNGFERYNRA